MAALSTTSPQSKITTDGPTPSRHKGPDLTVPLNQVEGVASPMLLSALTRQGFFVTNPDAPANEQQLGLPPKWQVRRLGAVRREDGEKDRAFILKDPNGRQRGVVLQNPQDPLQNRLSLTPRFAIEVVPARGNQYEIQLNDGDKKHHQLAQTVFGKHKRTKGDVLAAAQSIAAEILPDMDNPLTRWDMQSGHVKKQVGALRAAFGGVTGFAIPLPKASSRDPMVAPEPKGLRIPTSRQMFLKKVREQEILSGGLAFDPREDEHPLDGDAFRVFKQGLGW